MCGHWLQGWQYIIPCLKQCLDAVQEGYSHPFRDSSAWARVLELNHQHQAAPATVLQAAADCMVDAKVLGLKLEAVADSVAGKLLTLVLLIG